MSIHTHADGYVIQDGQLVNQRVARVVQAIHEYEPEIEVQWIPERGRRHGEAAFKIIHNDPVQGPFTLMHVNTEDEFDERVLQKIIVNDQRNGKVTLSEFEAWEEANKRVAHQKFLDELEEAEDVARHILESHKNTYVVNKDLVVKDGIPHNAAHLDSRGRVMKGSEGAYREGLGK